MIGKIKKGSGFKGCVNYVLGKEQAALLHAEGVLTESRGDIIRSFCMQTGMNPDLKKPVGHIALSYSATLTINILLGISASGSSLFCKIPIVIWDTKPF